MGTLGQSGSSEEQYQNVTVVSAGSPRGLFSGATRRTNGKAPAEYHKAVGETFEHHARPPGANLKGRVADRLSHARRFVRAGVAGYFRQTNTRALLILA